MAENLTPETLLRRMVEIQSFSGKEHDLAEFLVESMSQLGFESYRDKAGNAVGIKAGSSKATRDIVLLGHMDTVSGDIPVRRDGDLLYGRGTVDAKGPLAAFVSAVAECTVPSCIRLVVIGAVEEESATSKGARFAVDQFQPVACIIGEPSGYSGITLGYKGRVLARVEIDLPCSHSAGPGQTAAEAGTEWWNRVKEFCDQYNRNRTGLFDSLLPGLRTFNTSSDGLYERAEMQFGFRLPPDLQFDDFKRTVCEIRPTANVEFRAYEPAYAGERNSLLARSFLKAVRGIGERPKLKYKTGTSDMNVVGPRWSCPILAYGPGDSSLDHTPNEHISIAEYLKSIEVLNAALDDFMKTSHPSRSQ